MENNTSVENNTLVENNTPVEKDNEQASLLRFNGKTYSVNDIEKTEIKIINGSLFVPCTEYTPQN